VKCEYCYSGFNYTLISVFFNLEFFSGFNPGYQLSAGYSIIIWILAFQRGF